MEVTNVTVILPEEWRHGRIIGFSGTRGYVYPPCVLTESGKYFNGLCIQRTAATMG